MIRFEHIEILWGLLTVPLMTLIFLLRQRWVRKSIRKLGDKAVVNKLMPERSPARSVFKFICFSLAVAFMVVAMANPQMGSKMEQVKRKGIDMMIAIDLSNSMMAEDLYPNRLERAKRAISKLIDKLHGDRIGIVVFGGQAYVQLPITMDYAAAKMFLTSINPGMIPTQGTAIGTAIEKCMDSFDFENKTNKAILILTDGENHEDDAVAAARSAADKGVVVHAIGMGSPKGSPIPLVVGGRHMGFRKDKEGQTVITKLDEETLQQIAAAGNGMFVRSTNADSGIDLILEEVGKMEKTDFGARIYTDYEDRFQYFAGLSLLILLLDVLLPNRKRRWLRNIKLFETK
ncbi:MAG: VWA domain-containing protein [Flavobacteriales bacterium]